MSVEKFRFKELREARDKMFRGEKMTDRERELAELYRTALRVSLGANEK